MDDIAHNTVLSRRTNNPDSYIYAGPRNRPGSGPTNLPLSFLLDLLNLSFVILLSILERLNLSLIRPCTGRRPHSRTFGHIEYNRRLLGREFLGFRERKEDVDKVEDEDGDVDRVTVGGA